jgi:hypothetical protein
MRLVNTKAHGIFDYLMGLTLLACPYIFDFSKNGAPQKVCALVGIWIWIMSTITKYEFSMSKILNLRLHLAIDVLIGSFLAFSPWMFGFDHIVYKPHVVFGLTLIIVSLLTDRSLYYEVLLNLTQAKSQRQTVKVNRHKKSSRNYIASFVNPYRLFSGKQASKNVQRKDKQYH